MELQREDEETESPARNASPFVTASILLLGALIFLAVLGAGARRSSTLKGEASEYLLQGDVAFKFSQLGTLGPTGATSWRRSALLNYEKAARMDVPAAIRRLGVINGEEGNPAAPIFEKMLSPAVGKKAAREYRDEVALWGRIYGPNPVRGAEAARIVARVRELNLGPVSGLAVARVYEKAGMQAEAARERALFSRKVRASVMLAAGVVVFVALLGLAGIVVLVVYASKPALMSGAEGVTVQPSRIPMLWAAFASFLILFLLLAVLLPLVLSELFGRLEDAVANDVLALAGYIVAGILALALASRLLRPEGLREVGLRAKKLGTETLYGVAAYAAAVPLVAVCAVVSFWTLGKYSHGTEVHPIVFAIVKAGPWMKFLIFFVAAVAAPIVEEAFFRGVLLNALKVRFGVAGAVVLSSAAFAVIHPQLPAGFLPLFALACVLGAAAVIRGSLIPAMVAHGINNAVSFLIAVALLS